MSDQMSILQTRGLGFDYGKFRAVGDVSISVQPNTLQALIGPNGAGKTTFFNIVSGRLPRSRGAIFFEGRDISSSPGHERVKLGIARSFQITSLFPESSVLLNLQIAAMGMEANRALHFWSRWSKESERLVIVEEVLNQLELTAIAHLPVGSLSSGIQRIVEIGMCLVSKPRLLMLDEPLAGLGLADVPRIAALLQQLKSQYTILLVEHNMRVVMGISDRITVMFTGNVIAEGTPQEIRENVDVRRIYLGSTA
jgi:branched-chain amino acid transport system ATP-binding protein